MARYLFRREELPIGYDQLNLYRLTKLIFVGHGQLHSTTVLDSFAPGLYDTNYLNMQHLGAGHICFRSDSSFREILAILYTRSITTDILE